MLTSIYVFSLVPISYSARERTKQNAKQLELDRHVRGKEKEGFLLASCFIAVSCLCRIVDSLFFLLRVVLA